MAADKNDNDHKDDNSARHAADREARQARDAQARGEAPHVNRPAHVQPTYRDDGHARPEGPNNPPPVPYPQYAAPPLEPAMHPQRHAGPVMTVTRDNIGDRPWVGHPALEPVVIQNIESTGAPDIYPVYLAKMNGDIGRQIQEFGANLVVQPPSPGPANVDDPAARHYDEHGNSTDAPPDRK